MLPAMVSPQGAIVETDCAAGMPATVGDETVENAAFNEPINRMRCAFLGRTITDPSWLTVIASADREDHTMWRIGIAANVFLMIGFWIASQIVTAPVVNRLVQYPPVDGTVAMPALTQLALSIRPYTVLLPVAWAAVVFWVYRYARLQDRCVRNERLLALFSLTLVVGMTTLLFFGLAGLLPFLLIAAPVG